MLNEDLTVAKIAAYLGSEFKGDGSCKIDGLASIENATSGEATYLERNSKYRKHLKSTKASLVILAENDLPNCPTTSIISTNPHLSFAKLAELFLKIPPTQAGVHPTAVLGTNCHIHPSVCIGPQAVIGNNVTLQENVIVGAGSFIGDGTKIGSHTILWPRVTIYYGIEIGANVQIHSGVVIGADGFGYAKTGAQWYKVPQLGSVVIGDNVEIGANTTIDRGALNNTVIEKGVKIDNQVQIGHNVRIGEDSIIAGCVGIAGSTIIGKRCMIGGAACFAGHLSIADNTVITGMAGISKTITEPGIYGSALHAETYEKWMKNAIQFRHLYELSQKVKRIEKFLEISEASYE